MSHFDIFLSHNSADKGLVEGMAEVLQAEGLKPWLDKWCLVPGQPWQQELAMILRNCPWSSTGQQALDILHRQGDPPAGDTFGSSSPRSIGTFDQESLMANLLCFVLMPFGQRPGRRHDRL